MKWNTETDDIEHGSWFRGKLYPMRSDVSFDGTWMVYLAMGTSGETWSGLCKVPWLKTIRHSPNRGTWFGGGYWSDKRTLCTNGWTEEKRDVKTKLPFKLLPLSTCYGEDEGVLYPRLERDGWQRAGAFGKEREIKSSKGYIVACDNDAGWYWQPSAQHPTLRVFYRGYFVNGRTFEFLVDEHPQILDKTIDWATWDYLGQLVVARSGAVEKYRLQDLAVGQPAFKKSFEELTPPWA